MDVHESPAPPRRSVLVGLLVHLLYLEFLEWQIKIFLTQNNPAHVPRTGRIAHFEVANPEDILDLKSSCFSLDLALIHQLGQGP